MSFRQTLLGSLFGLGAALSATLFGGVAAAQPAQPPAATTPAPAATPAAPAGMGSGIATGVRGAWVKGSCAAPEAVLYITPRSSAFLPQDGDVKVQRFVGLREAGGWTIATARGAEAPRSMMKLDGNNLSTAEPGPKLRDDAIPGDTPVVSWQRCPSLPASFMLAHGEGLAALGALERLEDGCGVAGRDMRSCIETIVAVADVSGDKLLSPAELARLMRGLAWVITAQEDGSTPSMGAAIGGGMLGGVLAARLMVESYDYDGDGKLSRTELGQDRVALPDGTGSATGSPLRTEGLADGASLLRGLLDTIMGSGNDE
ncbi:hypothetical protein IAI18_09775 [Acetobacteraceae bacterium H6797]|nr:hypothetical protein [Acetobacteraceae bacterium H6797]